jgi:cytosine/adenosine deaminase-related metal-dependent hydrolase
VTFRVWCEHAWLGGPSASSGVLLEIDNERFSRVEMGFPTPPPGIAALPGLTLPGFVNPHISSLDRAVLGQAPHLAMSTLATLHSGITPEDLAELATAVYAELSLAGYTTIGEVVTLHRERDGAPFANPAIVNEALAYAAKRAGVRLALIDVCSLNGAHRSRHTSVHEWVQRIDPWTEKLGRSTTVRVIGGIGDQTGLGTRGLSDIALWSGQCGLPVHARINMAPVDGISPLTALVHSGAITNRGGFTAVGTTGASAEDLTAVAQQRGYVIAFASGHMESFPIGPFRMAGGRTVLTQSVSSPVDAFLAMRSLERVAASDQQTMAFRPSELMRTVTADAAASLGWRDGGLIASGQLADIVTVGTSRIGQPAPSGDMLEHALRYASSADITHVAIGGQLIVNNGQHRLGNVGELVQQAVARVARYGGVFQ